MVNSSKIVTTDFPTINLKDTGKNILKIRKEKNISVKDLQAYFGFEQPQAIYKWQWGESLPTVDNLYALSILFNMSINQILVSNGRDFIFFYDNKMDIMLK
jgi:transcriptional regulator with XRE-family HTH domain